ncbi:TrbG/VirB9 family P-type conjugative transfer protein [Ideonella azotifigens]|uniref:TrbG/VirB9 family P-type conjugative transfer protein n=1 Tax=Ideonella azotifigens TaxID=513160 RepID=A0ABN1JH08_9BURK|nr:TrbG/VirB9 family P-type conjugative transfer protein [Ideonella azotifigens]MCD2344705.1 TrbG/VirB9 family P-type conjugative transfer protein [Ideonella azotifigens]
MKACTWLTVITGLAMCGPALAAPEPADPRLREVIYDPAAVVTVPVKRGVVTLVVLDANESITEVAAGLGGDCAKAEAAWCVAAQAGGRNIFVKAKSSASAANNLAVVTDRRTHAFRFVVLADGDPKPPVYRLVVRAPAQVMPVARLTQRETAPLIALPAVPPPLPPEQVVAERLQAKPQVMNTRYSVAEGDGSQDIVPTLVFDDGRFTYLRFPGNREVPAVFHVLGDGSETLVNARMEDDLLVLDRVSRRLMLRAGAAVVGLWNEAFDLDGRPPADGTTVPGVQRVLKDDTGGHAAAATSTEE